MNLTKDSYFIDTNIIIYLFDHRTENKREISRNILKSALETGNGIVSFQVIQEFCNVALKRFERPLLPDDCKRFINRFLCPICSVFPGEELYFTALDIKKETGFSFYDSLIVSCASIGKCKVIYTEDLQDGQTVRGVKIINPFCIDSD